MVDQIIDSEGIERNCGSWPNEDGAVSSFPPTDVAGSPIPVWTDDEIRSVLTDPGRRKSDIIFPSATWICDQKSTSACNGWAASGALSRARYLRGLNDNFVGSGSFVYSLVNGGRDQGSSLHDGLKALSDHGTCSQELCTANMIYPSQQPPSCRTEASKHKGLACYYCPTKQAWRTATAAGFMGICCVHAGPNFNRFTTINSGSPCTKVAGVDNGRGNHACVISDHRLIDGVEYWLLDNSWNVGWASGGRAWVRWEHFEQTFGVHDFYVCPTTAESDIPLGASG